jgi:hypothetical protein
MFCQMTSPGDIAGRTVLVLGILLLIVMGCGSTVDGKSVLAEEIGIKTVAGFTPLISAGSALPALFEDDFSTSANNQRAVELRLYAGGADGNRRDLRNFVIDQIEPAAKGIPRIKVSLRVSESGKAVIRAVHQKTNVVKEVELGQLAIRAGQPASDVPWEIWVYFAVGFPVAYWYQRREKHPEHDFNYRIRILFMFILAWLWPVLLLAVLANRQDKPAPSSSKGSQ